MSDKKDKPVVTGGLGSFARGLICTVIVSLLLAAFLLLDSAVYTLFGEVKNLSDFCSYIGGSERISQLPFVLMIGSMLITASVFSDIHRLRLVEDRTKIKTGIGSYISHSFKAFIFIVIMLAAAAAVLYQTIPVNTLVVYAVPALSYFIAAMGISALISVLTTHMFWSAVVSAGIMLLPFTVPALVSAIGQAFLKGFALPVYLDFSIITFYGLDTMPIIPALCSIGVGVLALLTAIPFFINYGKSVKGTICTFRPLDFIFIQLISLFAAFAGFCFMRYINSDGILPMSVSAATGAIVFIIFKIICSKGFKPLSFILSLIVYAALLTSCYALTVNDICGYSEYIPESKDVNSVLVSDTYSHYMRTKNIPYDNIEASSSLQKFYSDRAVRNLIITDPADISAVINLHKLLNSTDNTDESFIHILPITYKLKNGRIITREYKIPTHDNMEQGMLEAYSDVMDSLPVKASKFPIVSDAEWINASGYVYSWQLDPVQFSSVQLTEITSALRKDCAAVNFDTYTNHDAITAVSITSTVPSADKNGRELPGSEWMTVYTEYKVYPSYENTIALLNEWGLYHTYPSPEEITSIQISSTSENVQGRILTDKSQISTLLTYIGEHETDMLLTPGDTAYKISIATADNKNLSFGLETIPAF